MGGITAIHTLPDGNRAEVDADVLGVARRLQDGDPTLGWEGDRALGLVFDMGQGRFEVWHTSITGDAYLVAHHHRCDSDLIRKVVAADQQKHNVFARMRAEDEALERERQRQHDDWFDNEWAPKARWAITRDIGHLLGGSRPSTSMHTPEAKP